MAVYFSIDVIHIAVMTNKHQPTPKLKILVLLDKTSIWGSRIIAAASSSSGKDRNVTFIMLLIGTSDL